MQYFNSIPLAASSLKNLDDLNQQIRQESVFNDKVNKAYTLWNAKTSTNDKRNTFNDVKKSLLIPLKNREVCAYCETNEPSDIEHIFPKKWQDTNYNGWTKIDADLYLDRFGNKTVFEKKLNIQAGNGYFGVKKQKYRV